MGVGTAVEGVRLAERSSAGRDSDQQPHDPRQPMTSVRHVADLWLGHANPSDPSWSHCPPGLPRAHRETTFPRRSPPAVRAG